MRIACLVIVLSLFVSTENYCSEDVVSENDSSLIVPEPVSVGQDQKPDRDDYDMDNESQMYRLQVEVSVQQADILLLTNGDSVEGVITNKSDELVDIETVFGAKTYDLLDIDFVEEISDAEREKLLWKLKILTEYNRKLEKERKELKVSSDTEKKTQPSEPEDKNKLIRRLQLDISVQQADILMLNNGDTIEGVIRETTDEIVSIETQYGLKIFDRKEIEFVEQISEKDRFELLAKLEQLQQLLSSEEKQNLKEQKERLTQQQKKAKESKQSLNDLTGGVESDLFSLTSRRLEEIVKEFSQFPPDYWRYYHRKSDALKTILRLKRLRRYAHPRHVITVNLYLKAFDCKIKEKGESRGSLLVRQYRDKYKSFFRSAEKRRSILFNPDSK